MDREEILRKSRAEGRDEGEIHALKSGDSWGFAGMLILYAVMYFATFMLNEAKMYMLRPAGTLFFTGWGLQQLGYGLKAKKKSDIVLGCLWLALGIAHLISYFKEITG